MCQLLGLAEIQRALKVVCDVWVLNARVVVVVVVVWKEEQERASQH